MNGIKEASLFVNTERGRKCPTSLLCPEQDHVHCRASGNDPISLRWTMFPGLRRCLWYAAPPSGRRPLCSFGLLTHKKTDAWITHKSVRSSSLRRSRGYTGPQQHQLCARQLPTSFYTISPCPSGRRHVRLGNQEGNAP